MPELWRIYSYVRLTHYMKRRNKNLNTLLNRFKILARDSAIYFVSIFCQRVPFKLDVSTADKLTRFLRYHFSQRVLLLPVQISYYVSEFVSVNNCVDFIWLILAIHRPTSILTCIAVCCHLPLLLFLITLSPGFQTKHEHSGCHGGARHRNVNTSKPSIYTIVHW